MRFSLLVSRFSRNRKRKTKNDFLEKFCSSCFSEEDPSRDGPQPNQTGRRVEKNCSPTGPRDARFPVIIPRGSHPFPSRTRKLSLAGPIVLRGLTAWESRSSPD